MAKKWGKAVEDKHKHLRPTAYEGTGVGMFECRYCPDTDKGMETILSSLKKGDDIFQGYGEEVKKKYRHLATFEFTPLGFWEQRHLDDDGGTTKIESTLLNMGTRPIFKIFDPFPGAPREAWKKYARLMPLYEWAHKSLDPKYDPGVKGSQREEWEKYYLLNLKKEEDRKLAEERWTPGFRHPNYFTDGPVPNAERPVVYSILPPAPSY